jgi:flavin reductase (DIM6/NTAB) family NADH-FMN oxidoreductase RutF
VILDFWVSRVNFKQPMIGVALGGHYTNKGIEEHGIFSVNIPDNGFWAVGDNVGRAWSIGKKLK